MELGYRFAPPEYPNAPGSPRLEINIYETPTLKHFDPEKVILSIVNKDGFPDFLTASHPWHLGNETYRVCVGHVDLIDRNGKKVIAYTLGGEMHVKRESKKTHCILESEAPILQLGKMFEIPSLLASEIMILISKRSAAWLPDSLKHQRLQTCAEPMELYAACLKTLKAKYETYEYQGLTHIIDFQNFITNEITALQKINRWPVSVSALEELI
jgi:hypothetical protein